VPFESFGAVSYSPSIVTTALSYIICEIEWLFGRKLRNFYTPPVFSTTKGGLCRNFAKMFDSHKSRMIGLLCSEEIVTICSSSRMRVINHNWSATKQCLTLICFYRIPERDGWTDRRTDRISISIRHVSTLTRDKSRSYVLISWNI